MTDADITWLSDEPRTYEYMEVGKVGEVIAKWDGVRRECSIVLGGSDWSLSVQHAPTKRVIRTGRMPTRAEIVATVMNMAIGSIPPNVWVDLFDALAEIAEVEA